MSARYSSQKRIARNIFIIFILLLLLLHPTGAARAASYTAGTLAELKTAINNANVNPGTDTITLTADITFTNSPPFPTLLDIASQIAIEGSKHTLSGDNYDRIFNVTSAGKLTINNLTVAYGNAIGGSGGGIYNTGTVTITNSTFSGNSAGTSGGGIFNFGTLTINNSTFSGNSTSTSGGGIYNTGTLTITNSSFSYNSANYGGGIINNNTGFLYIFNSTFSDNSADTDGGGGIRNDGILHYERNIIANSTGSYDCYNTGSIGTNNYNLVEINPAPVYSCNPSSTSDPALNPLADNGGPAQTHALQSSSPAIDVVPNGTSTGGIDQRGAVRDYNGIGTSSSNEGDLGAYEFRDPTSNCDLLEDTNITIENVTFNFSDLGTLDCVTVEEMGPGADHLLATGPGPDGETLHTDNWWYISGDGTIFKTSITLIYSSASAETRACKWPGNLGGAGWDCDNGTYTTFVANTSVTRSNITSFSDWAVGQGAGPTGIILINFNARSDPPWAGAGLVISVLAAGFLIILLLFIIRKQAHG